MDRNSAVPAVYLFLERGGKFLLMRRQNTGYEDGNYQQPSGHVEAGEMPKQAVVREAKEEIGVTVKEEDLEFLHVSYRMNKERTRHRVDFFFRTSVWEGEPGNLEPEKCDDLLWASYDELPPNTVEHVRRVIEDIRKGIPFSERY